jgi:L-amino acid N-acyltransferase YncA
MTDGSAGRSAQRARTVGRIHVLQYFAAPWGPDEQVDDTGIEVREVDGTLEVVAVADSGQELGVVRLHVRSAGDPFYGKYSRTDDRYIYGSALEVHPSARGSGIATRLMLALRRTAFDEGGRRVKSLVAPGNEASRRCHAATGFGEPVGELRGVRLGPTVLWLQRRSLPS